MNVLSTKWFYEEDMEDNNKIQEYDMSSMVGEVHEIDEYNLPHSFSSFDNNTKNCYDLINVKPPKILKTFSSSSSSYDHHHTHLKPHLHQSSSRILSFENLGQNVMDHQDYSPTLLNSIFTPKQDSKLPLNRLKTESIPKGFNGKGIKKPQPLPRSQSNAQEHIIAERKRREKLTQRFVALSAQVPGLKKMDKASVLGGALKHLKYLQESIREFEEQKKERTLESMVLVKRSKLIWDENNESCSSFDHNNNSDINFPEIEVRFSDKDVLIKILCEKQKGHIAKIVAEIEKLNFLITNTTTLPFGPTLDITIIAKKENDFNMTLMDVVKSLKLSISKFT